MTEDSAGPSPRPHFGHTKSGHPVHRETADYHPAGSRYQRVNKKLAVWLAAHVGSMTCFWTFCVLALLSLPATFVLMQVFSAKNLPGWLQFFLTFGWIYLITWICQNFIQLILLPALMVGQQLQNEAADARAAKQFEDVEEIKTVIGTLSVDVASIKAALAAGKEPPL